MNSNQIKTLSMQEQYAESVHEDSIKILNHTYSQIEKYQKTALDKIIEKSEKALARLEKKTDECLTNCIMAEDTIKKKVSEMKTISTITDFLYITAPLFVIGSFVLKLIELFG